MCLSEGHGVTTLVILQAMGSISPLDSASEFVELTQQRRIGFYDRVSALHLNLQHAIKNLGTLPEMNGAAIVGKHLRDDAQRCRPGCRGVSRTTRDAAWGHTDRDAAETEKQGRSGNLAAPSAEQRMIDFFVVFRIGTFLSQILITALPSFEAAFSFDGAVHLH